MCPGSCLVIVIPLTFTEGAVCQTSRPATQLSKDRPVHVQSKCSLLYVCILYQFKIGLISWIFTLTLSMIFTSCISEAHPHSNNSCIAVFYPGKQNNESNILCCTCFLFFFSTVEQFPCQQSRETPGPEIYGGPPHQYHLLQDEGAVTC